MCSGRAALALSAGQLFTLAHGHRWFGALRYASGFEDLNHCNCRLAKEFEQIIRSATAFLYAASAMMLIRRLARYA
jgi:hypothetical protein